MYMFNTGDRVKCIGRRLGHNSLVGMIGVVYRIDSSIYTKEEVMNQKGFNKIMIRAENWGGMMKSSLGKDKKVFTWKPDDVSTFLESELELI